jgi:L-fucose dehydrogenase
MQRDFTDRRKIGMDLQLKHKVVLVTGGAKGIGAAIVRGVAAEGGIAVIVDRDADAGNKLREELGAQGKACKMIQADLTATEACATAIEQILHEFGGLDVLVNNAGVNDKVGLEKGSPTEFEASLRRNLSHFYNLAHFGLHSLKKSRGSIVNIASKVAVTGQGETSGYAASKGAILALTREWAVELISYGVRVNAILPAEVMTPLYQQWLATFNDPAAKLREIEAKIPLGNRMTRPEEIAATALFLMSAQASHITGQHIFVDGGYTHLDRALA